MIVFGILTPLEHGLRHVLNWLHGTIGLPWAWSIVALTVIVRLILVPLTVRQIHSMQNLQRHAPQMKEIQKRYKGDRQKLNEELMKFYRENQINPASSCLPTVAQLPVFFSLYFVLRNFSKEAHNPKLGAHLGDLSWLHVVPSIADKASSHWSGFVLLVIYVVSQLASSYFMSTTMERSQRIMLLVLPVAFVAFIAHFPTGLVLYWVTTNLWTVGQGLITRRLVPKNAPPPPKRSSRTLAKEEPAAPAGGRPEARQPKPASAAAPSQPRKVKRKKQNKSRR